MWAILWTLLNTKVQNNRKRFKTFTENTIIVLDQKTEGDGVKGKKLWISLTIVVGIFAIAIAGGGYLIMAEAKPETVVDKFERAVNKRDVDEVLKLLISGDPVFTLDRERAAELIEYFGKEERVFRKELDNLRDQARGIQVRQRPSDILTLKEEETKFGGRISSYKIAVKPFYFKIHTNIKGAKIHLEEEHILTARSDDYTKIVGPLMPGTYQLEATYEGEYVSSVGTRETVRLPDQHNDLVNLDLDADFVYFYSDYPDAILHVNGRSTGLAIRDVGLFGPVPLDGSLEVRAKLNTDWGEFESIPLVIGEGDVLRRIEFDVREIPVYGAFDDARLYVNGKDTGLTLWDTNVSRGLGPFSGHETVQIHAVHESPWGVVGSEKLDVKIEDVVGGVFLNFTEIPEKIIEEVLVVMDRFVPMMLESVESYDPYLLEDVAEYRHYAVYYQIPFNNYFNRSYELIDSEVYFDWATVSQFYDVYYVKFDMKLRYYEYLHNIFSGTIQETSERESWLTITMQYDPSVGAWQINDMVSLSSSPYEEGAAYDESFLAEEVWP